MRTLDLRNDRINKSLHYSIMILCYIFFVYISWFRWGDILIDTFRDQWVSHKLTQGSVLYKDLYYLFGFFPPYFVALVYRIFGVSMSAIASLGMVITALSAFLMYRISRLFLSRTFSTLIVLNFLSVFAFAFYSANCIFNFVIPYTVASTFFITFLLASLYFFLLFMKKSQDRYLVFWGVCLYLALLSRFDLTLPPWIVFFLFSFIYARKEKKLVYPLYVLSPLLAAFFSYLAFLSFHNAFGGFRESVLNMAIYSASGKCRLNLLNSGMGEFHPNLKITLEAFFVQFSLVCFLYLIAKVLAARSKGKIVDVIIYCAALAVSAVAIYYVMENFSSSLSLSIRSCRSCCRRSHLSVSISETQRQKEQQLSSSVAFLHLLFLNCQDPR